MLVVLVWFTVGVVVFVVVDTEPGSVNTTDEEPEDEELLLPEDDELEELLFDDVVVPEDVEELLFPEDELEFELESVERYIDKLPLFAMSKTPFYDVISSHVLMK